MSSVENLEEFVKSLYSLRENEAIILTYATEGKHKQVYWREDLDMSGQAAYVCVSSVMVNAEYPRRRRRDCTAAHVLMLDDIGTKAKVPPVEPTAVLETSPGNYQYLYGLSRYELDTPESIARYEAVVKSLCNAGYGDPGAGTVTRVYRIPGSVNQKPGMQNWKTKAVQWNPERKWTLDSLVQEFGVPIEEITPLSVEAVGVDDPISDWLTDNNLVRAQHDDWLEIRCPWADDHSEEAKDDAAYSPIGKGEHPLYRGFNCFHEHCSSRRAPKFLAWVADQGGPSVSVTGVKEVSLQKFKQLLSRHGEVDKHEFIRNTLPELFRENLPDADVNSKGVVMKGQLATLPNVKAVCDSYGIQLRYNLHSRRTEAVFLDPNLASMYDARMTRQALIDGCQRVGIPANARMLEIIDDLAGENKYHPFADWIAETEWDETDRIQALTESVNVREEFEHVWPVYLKRWLIQVVQAVYGWGNPEQISSVLVLSGPQGVYKTQWLASLMPEGHFADGVHLNLGGFQHKDAIMVGTANTVVELGELEVTFQRSLQGALKAFLSNSIDVYRPPHGRHVLDIPRTTTFCATVNRADFLMDETGSRRFWPVAVTGCDPDHGVDLRQLWAQAYTLWGSGMKWWLTDEEEQQHNVLSTQFEVADEVIEALQSHMEHFGDTPKENWQAMNVSGIAQILRLNKQRGTLSSLRHAIERDPRLGPRKTWVQNVRNSWLFPTGESVLSAPNQ